MSAMKFRGPDESMAWAVCAASLLSRVTLPVDDASADAVARGADAMVDRMRVRTPTLAERRAIQRAEDEADRGG